ncbi:MAG: DUF1028 domain-containing protein [Actinobacteria bacterium]|nr:DUF1028 domain-containing protein [Actinomycetota bacterium]
MTFSIVAHDPAAQEWGVAVASKFLAVGSVVPWARAGAGAVATQSYANVTYGPDGLQAMEAGESAEATIQRLTNADDKCELRQVGMVDALGQPASFTGTDCFDWAGGRTGDGYACQGNILAGPHVVDRMVEAFEAGAGELATRLLAALAAGDAAGGDRRGRQSAALLVVRQGGGYLAGSDVAVDLRVDDHTDPVAELHRLMEIHRLLLPRPEDLEFVPIHAELARVLRDALSERGYDCGSGSGYDMGLRQALFAWVGAENLEARWSDGPEIEQKVLGLLSSR